jgi:hypothetical protein
MLARRLFHGLSQGLLVTRDPRYGVLACGRRLHERGMADRSMSVYTRSPLRCTRCWIGALTLTNSRVGGLQQAFPVRVECRYVPGLLFFYRDHFLAANLIRFISHSLLLLTVQRV